MAANWQRGVLRLMRVVNHPVSVIEIADFTPWYRRIRFSAPEFVGGLEVFPTLWLRLWVPNPAKGGDGYASQRGYTLVDVRPDEGTFALDFVLHDVEGRSLCAVCPRGTNDLRRRLRMRRRLRCRGSVRS